MRTRVDHDSAMERIRHTCDAATDGHDLFERLSADMHDVIPHDGAVWFGVDPATLLVASPVRVEAQEASSCDAFWHLEFHVADTAQFVDSPAAPSRQPASTCPSTAISSAAPVIGSCSDPRVTRTSFAP